MRCNPIMFELSFPCKFSWYFFELSECGDRKVKAYSFVVGNGKNSVSKVRECDDGKKPHTNRKEINGSISKEKDVKWFICIL